MAKVRIINKKREIEQNRDVTKDHLPNAGKEIEGKGKVTNSAFRPNSKEFKPTTAMEEVLKAWADPTVKPTVTAVCAKADIAPKTWYSWWKKEGFEEWWNEQWNIMMKRSKHYLDNVALKMSAKGDFRYFEFLYSKYHDHDDTKKVRFSGISGILLEIDGKTKSLED